MPQFRIVDLRSGVGESEINVEGKSPEHAAETALGMKLVRSGHPRGLVCRVYWSDADNTNMVRLYTRVTEPRAESH